MIVKRIKANKSKSKAGHVRALLDYVREVDGKNLVDYVRAFGDGRDETKVAYTSSRGFPHAWGEFAAGEQHLIEQAHMIALANECPKAANPLAHWVLSWREGEQPTNLQADRAVSILLEQLGMADHQCIYALHRDTENVHLHVVVNRVHPSLLKVADPHNGFDRLAAARAVALIEHAQGWEPEANARYRVECGELRDMRPRSRWRKISDKARRKEGETGEASRERRAIEVGAPLIEKASSWAELHSQLAGVGMRFQKKGSGAVLVVGDVAVKASSAGRGCSLGKLEKRLGPFVDPPPGLAVVPIEPVPVASSSPMWADYARARKGFNEARDSARSELKERHQGERDGWFERARERRRALAQQSWKGRGAELNAQRSLLAAELAKERAAMLEKQRAERAALARRFQQFPTYEEWLRENGQHREAAVFAYRETLEGALIAGPADAAQQAAIPRVADIRDYQGKVVRGGAVAYFTRGASVADFVDEGRAVHMRARNDDALLAGLQLAQSKFSAIRLSGNPALVQRAAVIAARHGIRVVNPEVQALMQAERDRVLRSAPGVVSPPPAPARVRVRSAEQVQQFAGERESDSPAVAAYLKHSTAVFLRRHDAREPANASAVDREAALRMRLTGWAAADIQAAVREGALRWHPKDEAAGRDWPEYSRRCAASAFTPAADLEALHMQHLAAELYTLEGRVEPKKAEFERLKRELEERERDAAARRAAQVDVDDAAGRDCSAPPRPRGLGM